MNKNASIIITFALIFAFGIIFWGGSSSKQNLDPDYLSGNNVEIRDGIQYVKINAKAGYFPRLSVAKAGIPTKLVMNTKGTFDCSAALVIRSINYQNVLPQNGETEIDIGTWEAGKTMQGLCSMGMYNFQVKFD